LISADWGWIDSFRIAGDAFSFFGTSQRLSEKISAIFGNGDFWQSWHFWQCFDLRPSAQICGKT